MKTFTLSEKYQITHIEQGGEKLDIHFLQEGIEERDFVFLGGHPELQNFQYEVVSVHDLGDAYSAKLVRLPVKEDSIT